MMHHAFLSASSSHRWLKCPIAPTLESKIPQTTSVYAQEGTFAHNLLAHCLTQGIEAQTLLNQKLTFEGDTRIINDEMVSSVQLADDYIRSFAGEFLTETEVPLEPFTTEKGATGTADIIIFNNDQWIIADFKYGAGVSVSSENNTQLMLYACGALHQYGDIFGAPETITLTIIQPRIKVGEPLCEWTITTKELWEKAQEFRVIGKRALSLKGKRVISLDSYGVDEGACRFCRAKVRCPALARQVLLDVTLDPSSEVDLSKSYSSLPLIKHYVKAVEDVVFKRLSEGSEVKGYHLITGRKGNRAFKDPDKVEEVLTSVLGDNAFKKTLLSPKEVEQYVKEQIISDEVWQELQDQIVRGDGKPVIAPCDIPYSSRSQKAQLNDFEVFTT